MVSLQLFSNTHLPPWSKRCAFKSMCSCTHWGPQFVYGRQQADNYSALGPVEDNNQTKLTVTPLKLPLAQMTTMYILLSQINDSIFLTTHPV